MKAKDVARIILGDVTIRSGRCLDGRDMERIRVLAGMLSSDCIGSLDVEVDGDTVALAQVADALETTIRPYEFDDTATGIIREGVFALQMSRGVVSTDPSLLPQALRPEPIQPEYMRRRRMLHEYPFPNERTTIVRNYWGRG